MKKALFVLALALILVCFVLTKNESPPTDIVPVDPLPTPVVELSLVAVGDNLIHGPIYKEAAARADGDGFDFDMPYQQIAPYVQNADLAFINQETPLGGTALGLSSYPNFNSPQELGDYLLSIGFNLFSQANNHILDKGQKGFNKTVDYWLGKDASQGVMAGIYASQELASKIPVYETKGVRTAFLAYTFGTNGIALPASADGVVAYINQDKILADVDKAHDIADIVIVSLHWGNEYQTEPTEKQRALAQALANADVDLIIGHHPHVIQPVESMLQPDGGQTLVYYSLGNFISNQNKPDTMLGGMAEVEFSYSPDDKVVSITSAKFTPLVTQYEGKYKNTRIIPLSDYNDELANSHGVHDLDSSFTFSYLKKLVTDTINAKYLDVNFAP